MKPFLRILLPAAVCGLLLGACTQRQTTLKFMSYNIRNGRGIDNVQDLGRVAEIINRTAPDIVALQELDSVTGRMAGRFIPGELGEMTGMHARFCRAIDYDGGAYGVGLLSRDEPLAVRRIPLPGREESRVLCHISPADIDRAMQDAIRRHRTGGSHADAEDVRSADFLLFSPVQLPVQSVQYGHPDVQQKTLRCRLPSGRNFPSFQKRSILCRKPDFHRCAADIDSKAIAHYKSPSYLYTMLCIRFLYR